MDTALDFPGRKSPGTVRFGCYTLVAYADAWIVLLLVATSDRMLHWFILPTYLCGMVIGVDALRWLKGDYDLFDPKGIIGALGWHGFFLAPLLFIYWEVGMRYVPNPEDWRPWVGYLSLLNLAALWIYQKSQVAGFRSKMPRRGDFWQVNRNRALSILFVFLCAAVLAQGYYFQRVGGLGGVLDLTAVQRQTGVALVTGVGIYEILGGSLPLLLLIALTLSTGLKRRPGESFLAILFCALALGTLQFLLGGVKGTRSATVWSLFWIGGILHTLWRPFSRRFALVAVLFLGLFMYFYGFFKGNTRVNGLEALSRLFEGASLSEMETVTGRSFKEMAVADLARVDAQSYELYRLAGSSDYRFRWGKTYFSAFLSYIPGWIWPGRPLEPEKIVAGTELFYGRGAYVPGDATRNIQKVYGLGGEAILNFGILAYPLPFALWGFLMGRYRRGMLAWQEGDFRWLLAPLVTLLFLIALIGDFYNLLGFWIVKGLLPTGYFCLALILAGQKVQVA